MKKFSILFTLLLLVSFAFGQIVPLSSFSSNTTNLSLGANISVATLTTTGTSAQDCSNLPGGAIDARKLTSQSPSTISLSITPQPGFEMTIISVSISLLLSGSSGTATVTVGGVPFTSGTVGNVSCTALTSTGSKVSTGAVQIDIVVSGYSGNRTLTFDEITVDGSVIAAVLPIELSKFNVK